MPDAKKANTKRKAKTEAERETMSNVKICDVDKTDTVKADTHKADAVKTGAIKDKIKSRKTKTKPKKPILDQSFFDAQFQGMFYIIAILLVSIMIAGYFLYLKEGAIGM